MGTHLPVRQASRLICAIAAGTAMAACNTTAPMYSGSNSSVSLGSLAGSFGVSNCPTQSGGTFLPKAITNLQFSRTDNSPLFYLPPGAYAKDWSTHDETASGSYYGHACPVEPGCLNLIAHLGNDEDSEAARKAHHTDSISTVVCNISLEDIPSNYNFAPPDYGYEYPYAHGGYSRPAPGFGFGGYRSPRYQYQ